MRILTLGWLAVILLQMAHSIPSRGVPNSSDLHSRLASTSYTHAESRPALWSAVNLRGGSIKQTTAPAISKEGRKHEKIKEENTKEPVLTVAKKVKGGFLRTTVGVSAAEMPKFLAMSFMMFFIIYVFTMTRDTKDTLIVTNCGAESIAFLKVYGVVPAAAAFMIGYNYLSNHVSSRALFHMTIIPFFVFYGLFGLVLYPMRDLLHHPGGAVPHDSHGLSYIINLGRFWLFSVYYIVSELWGSAGVPLLFWTCANEVTPISQAKRFYSLFGLLGNLAPIASGQTMIYIRNKLKASRGLSSEGAFESSIKALTIVMMVTGVVILSLFEFVHGIHRREIAILPPTEHPSDTKKHKEKVGLMDSFKVLARSRYLRNISLMVLSYGLSMEFTEIIWKSIVKVAYPDKSDYLAFMGQYSKNVGFSTFFVLLFGNKLIKYFGWEFGALATPIMMALLSIPFFGILTFGDIHSSREALMKAVTFGMIQNILSKATKYALFDPTKEMAYIPLDKASKVKGKAAIDVLGARLGKSGGALAQQGLVVMFGSILSGAPVLAVMFAVVCVVWIFAVLELGTEFHHRSAELEKRTEEAAVVAAKLAEEELKKQKKIKK